MNLNKKKGVMNLTVMAMSSIKNMLRLFIPPIAFKVLDYQDLHRFVPVR